MTQKGPILPALMLAIAAMLLPSPVAAQAWNFVYEDTELGKAVGNPDAQIALTAFISYTCSACGAFEKASDAPMRLGYIGLGKVRLEVRPLIRNSVDTAATLLAQCGPKEKFFDNHRAIFFAQASWLPRFLRASPAQKQRWDNGPMPSRMRAVAADMQFYDIMERQGFSRSETDRCLADAARAAQIEDASKAQTEAYQVQGTPSFLINDTLLDHVHDWRTLERELNNKLALGRITRG